MTKKPFFALAFAAVPFLAAALAFAPLACGANLSSSGDGGTVGTNGGDGAAGGDSTVGGGGTPLPCDVNKVVVEHCQTCHGNPTANGAPMSMVNWEDFQAVAPNISNSNPNGLKVFQLADQRIHSTTAPMPQPPNPALDTADLATMDAWATAGAPAGTAACVGDAGATLPDGATPTVTCNSNNAVLAPATPYTIGASQEQYVCYSVNLPATGTNHVLAITPEIDNHAVVHHILLFQADPNDTSITTTPQPCSAGGSLTWRIVYGWAPGGGAMQTPPDVGFPYDSTTKWVVQIHYNNVKGTTAGVDSSGFQFCSTDQPVKYDSDVIAFGTQNISIPPDSVLDQTCNVTVSSLFAGIHLFAAFPHMHQTGTAIQTEQTFASGPGIVGLAQNSPWNFNTQLWFPVDGTLNVGDVVHTRCAWQNSTGSTITFGQDTENEMCYSFTAYYPKITSAAWSWALPAIESSCGPSPDGGLPMPDAGWTTGPGFGDDAGLGGD